VPLGIARSCSGTGPRTGATPTATAEDLAGIAIVVTIVASSVFAGYEAIRRLLHPQQVHQLGWVAAAAILGFAGNEIVARYRITIRQRIRLCGSDRRPARPHRRIHLPAVLLGAGGVALRWQWADPIVGLAITVAIALVLKNAAQQIYRRLLDAVDPQLIDTAETTLRAIPGVRDVSAVRMRWIGHNLHAEAELVVDAGLSLLQAHAIAGDAEHQLTHAIPRLVGATMHTDPSTTSRSRTRRPLTPPILTRRSGTRAWSARTTKRARQSVGSSSTLSGEAPGLAICAMASVSSSSAYSPSGSRSSTAISSAGNSAATARR
jgi:cation diffusion facilitator family transporter